MAKDIRFYDFQFNLLYILAPFSKDTGYRSINAEKNLNGSGALEIVFSDPELKKIVEEYKDTLLVSWRGFWGFITSWRWDKDLRLCGMHLNGLLHRSVIPPTNGEITGDIKTLLKDAIEINIPWLEWEETGEKEYNITYKQDSYTLADGYIEGMLDLSGTGYEITADVKNKSFKFHHIEKRENPLMLSQSNLNAYDFETTYINKELAFGGWYKEEQEEDQEGNKPDAIWKYISTDSSKEGIYKIDCVLSATTFNDAQNELLKKRVKYEVLAKTKDIEYGKDYAIGDVIRVQDEGVSLKKLVSGVRIWDENGYGEEPILTDFKEE